MKYKIWLLLSLAFFAAALSGCSKNDRIEKKTENTTNNVVNSGVVEKKE